MMQAVSFSELRRDMKNIMNQIQDHHEPTVITRKQGNMVLMSLEDYNALEETAYLLKSPKNAEHIFAALAELREGCAQERELIEI